MFDIFPAIDILEGKCVRLFQGNYNLRSEYYSSPLLPAQKWEEAGASWLHIVDLDGAREARAVNLPIVKEILEKTSLKVQIGGGIRSSEMVEEYLRAGAERVIIGSEALKNPDWIFSLLEEFSSSRIVVSLDSRGEELLTEGWLEESGQDLFSVAEFFASNGVENFIYTDTTRDGTLLGPNLENALKLAELSGKKILVAGGISSEEDVLSLAEKKDRGIAGAIIGRALYTGDISLENLLKKWAIK